MRYLRYFVTLVGGFVATSLSNITTLTAECVVVEAVVSEVNDWVH